MRLATLTRRTVAVLASTALITSGAASFAGPAQAAIGPVPTQTPTSASPAALANSGNPTITVFGTNLNPATARVALVPRFTAPDAGEVPAFVDRTSTSNSTTQLTVVLGAASQGDFQLGSTLDNYAPGPYDIKVGNESEGFGQCNRTCFTLTQNTVPTATSSAKDTPTGHNGDGAVIITGKNISVGATVVALTPDGQVDNGLTFTPSAGSSSSNIYDTPTTLRADYTYAAGFAVGRHLLRITNTDGQFGVGTAEFWQPSVTAVTPSRIGRGGSTTVTVTGPIGAFRPGTRFAVASTTPIGGNPEVVTGATTVSSDGSTLTATVSVDSAAALQARQVTVRSPDGAYFAVPNAITTTARPSVSCIVAADATACPATTTSFNIGRGAKDVPAKIIGTGFVNVAPTTAFSFGGGGLTATVPENGVTADGTAATVLLSAAPDAIVGGRSVTATNPDFGAATTGANSAGTFPIVVNLAPSLRDVLPLSTPRNVTQSVTLNGDDFVAGMKVDFLLPGGEQTRSVQVVGTPTVTQGSSGSPDVWRGQVSTSGSAPAGPRDIVLTNPDKGTTTCLGCYKVDSLVINSSTLAGTNSDVSRRVAFVGPGLPATGTAKLLRTVPLNDQPAIVATSYAGSADGSTGEAFFDLRLAAPGQYDAQITDTNGNVLFCTACYTITGGTVTLTKITPNAGGQGAVDRQVTVNGTGLSRGMKLSIGSLPVTDVTYVPATDSAPAYLTALVDIPVNATVDTYDVVLKNADDSSPSTLVDGFRVNMGPRPATSAPAAKGQGATEKTITVTGPGFVGGATGSQVSLGEGITVVSVVVKDNQPTATAPAEPDDTIVVTFTVATDAKVGPRDVVVTNPDGGRGVVPNGLTINPGPQPVSISPSQLKAGEAAPVQIVGTGFASDSVPSIPGVTFTEVTLGDDGSLNATATVDAAAPLGAADLTVKNSDDGTGVCTGCFRVVTVPGLPQSVTATPGVKSATVAWSPPTTDGGTPVTGYQVSDGVNPAQTVDGATTQLTLTGLTAGTSYDFSVLAVNGAGSGPAAHATATPYDVPLAPTSVTATSTSNSITVSWSGADPKGSPITNYTIKRTNGTSTDTKEVDNVQSYTYTDVVPGSALTFTVAAKNAAGYGDFSTASATATAKIASTLTSVRPGGVPLSGTAITYRGNLKDSNGPIAGATIQVSLTPDIGNTRVVAATTDASGNWSVRVGATYNTTVRASYAGSSTQEAATATAYKLLIAAKVTRTSPATGSRSSAASPVAIRGAVSPNKAGRVVNLYEGTRLLQRVRIASNGTWAFSVKLPRGNHRLVVTIAATSGNAAGKSAAFTLVRV